MLFSFNEFGMVAIAIMFILFIDDKKSTFIKNFLYIITVLAFIEASVVILQFFYQRPIGINFENLSPFQTFSSDDINIFRPAGFRQFSLYTSFIFFEYMLMSLIFILKFNSKEIRHISMINLLLSIFIVVLTRTRSEYISTGILFLLILWKYNQTIFKPLFAFIIHYIFTNKIFRIFFLGSMIVIVLIVSLRIAYSVNTFSLGGTFYGRYHIEKMAWSIINKNRLFGVGTMMSVAALYKSFPREFISIIPMNIHNAYLVIFMENGFFALFSYISIYCLYFILIWKSRISMEIKGIVVFTLINSLYIMFFNPIKIFSPIAVILLFIIANTNYFYEK